MAEMLRELERAASPGPWTVGPAKWPRGGWWGIFAPKLGVLPMFRLPPLVAMLDDAEMDQADAALIAATRNALPLLLDVVEAAESMWNSLPLAELSVGVPDKWEALGVALARLDGAEDRAK